MKVLQSLLLVTLLLVGAALASDVLDLTEENFDAALRQNQVLLVEFYAPWCGHCKTLAPKYEQAATQLKGIASIAKVDCTAQEGVCSRFGVRGYPTIKSFRDGKPQEYNGGREVDAIVSFMKKQVLPVVSTVTAETLAAFADAEKVVVVGFFDTEADKEAKAFTEAADSLRESASFALTTDAAALTAHSVKAPAIILFKKFDERKNVFDGSEFTKATISAFVKHNSIPTMDDIGPQNYQQFMDSGLPLAYLFVTAENRATTGAHVEAVAKDFKGKVNFVYIDATQYGGHANNVNLKVGEWPAFSVHYPKENNKFPFSGEITSASIRAHVEGVLAGTIEPHVKSQPIPEEQGNVKVLVGKNYNEIVKASGKDVFIEFYAPWCGHCKKLAPIYDELGDHYAASETVIIAKMDATENDLPAGTPFQIQGFPTIKFIKADGTILSYEGDRTLVDFVKYIDENGTAKITADKAKDEL